MTNKIFITIPWFLPAFRAGGPVQSIANLVKEFKENDLYYIFCGDTDLNGAELENIETNKWVHFNEYTQIWYAGPEKRSDGLVKQVEKIHPDYLFIIGMFSWHFNIVPLIFCKGPKKILSTRGMLNPGALSQKKWKKKIYLSLFKLFEYHHSIPFHATDEGEGTYIREYFGSAAKVFVAGNFPNRIGSNPLKAKKPGSLMIVSVALISPMKNILTVLNALEKSTATIGYHIYGPIKDEDYWDICKEKIRTLPANITVTYHREIEPKNIPGVLLQSHVFVLPSKSENFGHAIYEALSAGLPVITSENTPWNNLKEANAGINVSLKNRDELADAIDLFASMDETTFLKWHEGASIYASKAINVEKIKEEYRNMFTL